MDDNTTARTDVKVKKSPRAEGAIGSADLPVARMTSWLTFNLSIQFWLLDLIEAERID